MVQKVKTYGGSKILLIRARRTISSTEGSLGWGTSAERSCHEIFFSRHRFSHEKCSEFSPKFLSLYLWVRKKTQEVSEYGFVYGSPR